MMKLMLLCLVSTLGLGRALLYPADPSTALPIGVNTSSGAITVPLFTYWGQSVSNIWVSQHGILTFDGDNSDPEPTSLPFATSAGNEGKLLALFWANHGALGNDVSYYTSSDAALRTQASNDVATYFPCEASFTPTNIFVVTWDDVWPADNHNGYDTYYQCYTNTHTHPHQYIYSYSTTPTHKTIYSTYFCYTTLDYSTYYCYTDSYGSYLCTTYLSYISECYTSYYTYTLTTDYHITVTWNTWRTSTTTTSYCLTSYTYAPANTYQAILATDGSRTFAFLYYEHDLQWYNVDGANAVAGFNRGDGVNSLSIPVSGTSQMFYLASASNVGVDGLFAFRVDNAPTDTPCSDCECHLAGTLVTFSLAVVNPVSGSGKQKVILVERSDVGDACRFRLQAIVKLEDGHVEVKRVIFRFGLHTNPNQYPTRIALKTDAETITVDGVQTPLMLTTHYTDPDGTHINVQRTGLAYHVDSTTCGWSFDYDPVADTVDYIGDPVVTTGRCGSCV